MPGLMTDAEGRTFQALELAEAEVVLYPTFFSASVTDRLLRELRDTTAWRQETITLYGKTIDVPRLTAWYGDEGTTYVYSGIKNVPLPWTPALIEVKQAVEPPSDVVFNSVLVNRYRTGKDSVSWHADNEPEFGAARHRLGQPWGHQDLPAQTQGSQGVEGERRADARQPAHHARRHAGELAAPDPEDGETCRGAAEPDISVDRRPGRVSGGAQSECGGRRNGKPGEPNPGSAGPEAARTAVSRWIGARPPSRRFPTYTPRFLGYLTL